MNNVYKYIQYVFLIKTEDRVCDTSPLMLLSQNIIAMASLTLSHIHIFTVVS